MSPFDAFVDRIYEASVVPACWPEVLRHLADMTQSREAALIATDTETFKWIGSSPAAEKLAAEHYAFEGGPERSRRLIRLNRPGFHTDFDVFSEAELAQLPVFRDYLIPNNYGRGIATVIEIPTGETIIVHAEGDMKIGRPSRMLLDRLDAFRPHFARSAMISARLAFERAQTAVETLSSIGLPDCAVGPAGRVLVANAKFDETNDLWTTRGGDRVALIDQRAERQLAAALRAVSTYNVVRSIALPATETAEPAVLHVVPIRRSAHDLFTYASAIIVVTTASGRTTEKTSLLKALFDLSPVEACIAARVAAGQTLQQIAVADAKSLETVRGQLKSVLAKTSCRRQLDLARMVTMLVPPNMTA